MSIGGFGLKTSGKNARNLDTVNDFLIWYSRDVSAIKYRQLFYERTDRMLANAYNWIEEADSSVRRLKRAEVQGNLELPQGKRFASHSIISQSGGATMRFPVTVHGIDYYPSRSTFWKTNGAGMEKLAKAGGYSR